MATIKYTKDMMIDKLFVMSEKMNKVVQNNTNVSLSSRDIMKEAVHAINDNNAYHIASNELIRQQAKRIVTNDRIMMMLVIALIILLYMAFITLSFLLAGGEILPFIPKLPL